METTDNKHTITEDTIRKFSDSQVTEVLMGVCFFMETCTEPKFSEPLTKAAFDLIVYGTERARRSKRSKK